MIDFTQANELLQQVLMQDKTALKQKPQHNAQLKQELTASLVLVQSTCSLNDRTLFPRVLCHLTVLSSAKSNSLVMLLCYSLSHPTNCTCEHLFDEVPWSTKYQHQVEKGVDTGQFGCRLMNPAPLAFIPCTGMALLQSVKRTFEGDIGVQGCCLGPPGLFWRD